MQWCRLYSSGLYDFSNPQIQTLDEPDQRRLIMLYVLQSKEILHELSLEEVASFLRISTKKLEKTIEKLATKRLITCANGVIKISDWDKMQYVSDSSTERVRRYRAKGKEEEGEPVVEGNKDRSGNVTVTQPDTDTDTEHKNTIAQNDGDAGSGTSISKAKNPKRIEHEARIDKAFEKYWLQEPQKRDRLRAKQCFHKIFHFSIKASKLVERSKNFEAHFGVRLEDARERIAAGEKIDRWFKLPSSWMNATDFDEAPPKEEESVFIEEGEDG